MMKRWTRIVLTTGTVLFLAGTGVTAVAAVGGVASGDGVSLFHWLRRGVHHGEEWGLRWNHGDWDPGNWDHENEDYGDWDYEDWNRGDWNHENWHPERDLLRDLADDLSPDADGPASRDSDAKREAADPSVGAGEKLSPPVKGEKKADPPAAPEKPEPPDRASEKPEPPAGAPEKPEPPAGHHPEELHHRREPLDAKDGVIGAGELRELRSSRSGGRLWIQAFSL